LGIINTYFDEIVRALSSLTEESLLKFRFMEYFPPNSGAKAVVWDMRVVSDFSMYNYVLSSYLFRFPPYALNKNWDTVEDKGVYLKQMLGFFDARKRVISDAYLEQLHSIARWIGKRLNIRNDIQQSLFDRLNEEMRLYNEQRVSVVQETALHVCEINNRVRMQLEEDGQIFGYDSSLTTEESSELLLRPQIVDRRHCDDVETVVSYIVASLQLVINEQVSRVFPYVDVSFDAAGVEELLKVLESGGYDRRNYTYIDDLAFEQHIKESPEFAELKRIITGIDYVDTPSIRSYMFFREKEFEFNAEVTSYSSDPLSDEEASLWVSNFEVAEGLYKLDNAYYSKGQAIDWVKAGYRKLMISIKLTTTFREDGGVQINFK